MVPVLKTKGVTGHEVKQIPGKMRESGESMMDWLDDLAQKN